MKISIEMITARYRLAHNEMRNVDGLQPSEALDELLKYLLIQSSLDLLPEPLSKIDALSSESEIEASVDSLRTGLALVASAIDRPATGLFAQDSFVMSDYCLAKVHEILGATASTDLEIDVQSAALRTFLGPEVRKSLGIYLTPDEIVTEIVNCFEFQNGDRVLDCACGSGTFLSKAQSQAVKRGIEVELFGIDKSPRMMLLSNLNIGEGRNSRFAGVVADTLRNQEYAEAIGPESVDYILTNPPFGVTVDEKNYDLAGFRTAGDNGSKRHSSELLFVEQSLKLLKPGGWLAIVLPKSAINTRSAEAARSSLGQMATVRAVVDLPSETFAVTGTMTNTVVLIIEKFGGGLSATDTIAPIIAKIDNVGFDNTGRSRDGSQLPGLGASIHLAMEGMPPDPRLEILESRSAGETFTSLPEMMSRRSTISAHRKVVKLGDLIESATTGTTPSRASYANSGLFLIKVGNLSGSGVNWVPRDRNFIDNSQSGRRYLKETMIVRRGDILLTSSAHNPRYIAKKIDVISTIPDWVGGAASYVGEVMMLRPKKDTISPFRLAAYLRLPDVVQQVQQMISGQTAHLRPKDIINLEVDAVLLFESETLGELADSFEEQTQIAERSNALNWRQIDLSEGLFDQACAS